MPTKKTKNKIDHIENYEKIRNSIQNEQKLIIKGVGGEFILESIKKLKEEYIILKEEHNINTIVHLKDSEILKETSKIAVINAENNKKEEIDMGLDLDEFLNTVFNYLNERKNDEEKNKTLKERVELDLKRLGNIYYRVSRKSVTNGFLNCIFDDFNQKIERKKKDGEESEKVNKQKKAESINIEEIHEMERDKMTDIIQRVYHKFVEINGSKEMNFFEFFIDPNSFGVSVENLFYTSFLIKDLKMKISLDEKNQPMILKFIDEHSEEYECDETSIFKNIATFNYKSWQNIVLRFNIQKCFFDLDTDRL